ncbi:hypothetical protein C8R44DRAFT_754504 [Mycena epipterygia]|nr:hypothetical protein C8R44DRAFT_754504 [Mycena epipterygia]
MLNKFISSALLFLVLVQGAMASPKPIACGGPTEPACPPPCVPACMILDRDFTFLGYSSSLQQAQTLSFAAGHSLLGESLHCITKKYCELTWAKVTALPWEDSVPKSARRADE